ncbi:MAG: hypothetical protein HQ582_19745 [Planctomycetes bacterium]|nr:hypothetical protein [Planctomycetota bacterium]
MSGQKRAQVQERHRFRFTLGDLLLWSAAVAAFFGVLKAAGVDTAGFVVLTVWVVVAAAARLVWGVRATRILSIVMGGFLALGGLVVVWTLGAPDGMGVGAVVAVPIVGFAFGCGFTQLVGFIAWMVRSTESVASEEREGAEEGE